jgi:hypothetical protein
VGAAAQSSLVRQATQVPPLQRGVAPEQAAHSPPTAPQCAASTGWQIPFCRQPLQVGEQEPSALHTCEPQV